MAKKNKVKKAGMAGSKNEIWMLLPVLFMVTLFLFAVRGRIVPSNLSDQFWYSGGEVTGDLFAYFRMQAFVLITIVFLLYMLFLIFTGELKVYKHKVYVPMVVYAVLVVISYMASEYKDIALWGGLQRYEGTVTRLCYMVILFYTIHAVRSEKAVGLITKCFAVAGVVLGIYGILQVFGLNLYMLPQWLYVPENMREIVRFNASRLSGAVTLFFGNQNYTSFFLIFPVCIFALATIGAENMKRKVFYAVLTGVMVFCLWQAASLGGMVGIAVSVVAAFIVAGTENIKRWRKSLLLLVLVGVIATGASLPVIMREVQSGTNGIASTVLGIEEAYAAEEDTAELQFVPIDYIITKGEDIIISFAGEEVTIKTENNKLLAVVDSNGVPVPENNPLFRISTRIDEDKGYYLMDFKTANKKWIFTVHEGETFLFAPSGKATKVDKVESIGFENNQDFATNRGYIWSRTLPLLKDTMLIGRGADTFALYFPQNDYAGKYNINYCTDTENVIVDKPHNMYLGVAVNIGMIAMIAFTAIFVIYLVESVKTYHKGEFKTFSDYIGMGIFVSVAGFMVAGLVNDANVQFMPTVYVLLGTGYAINRMRKGRRAEE